MPPLDLLPGRYAVRDNVLHQRRQRPFRPLQIAVVLVLGLGVAVAGQFILVRPMVEDGLSQTASQALAAAGYPNVVVAVHGRDVDLSDVPDDPAQIDMVSQVVGEVPGVHAVHTGAVASTLPPVAASPTPAGTAEPVASPSGSTTVQAVASPPAPLADLATVGATLDSGRVVLFGSVPSQAARTQLVETVVGGYGTGKVSDRISVEAASGGYGLDGFAQVLLAMGPQARAAAVSVRTGRMYVAGVVPDEAVRQAVRTAARDAVGENSAALTDTMTVDPASAVGDQQVAAQLTALPAITFASRSASLTQASRPVIEVAATLLRAHPKVSVRVEGHTDSTGIAETNLTLSRERADAVVAALREAGVPARQLSARGYGSTRRIAQGESDLVDALNRRVVLVATVA